ncbi:MAG: excinuclease ABC subunit UvrA [Odoribacteraceae bacterium]|jgi:excinuclease ABC subunit A|nr:excinuclease ABC subunit UvrA [Odoribacteraceae bacterium]
MNHEEDGYIAIYGAREHNLKNIDLKIPRDTLTVITGLSGSGKSSLAFDTIHAEGQRRYLETFSAYARRFLGGMERPDVDKITGLSPVISIEQKTTNKNPRSTVGTITEIYDFFRLLYARAGTARSFATGSLMTRHTDEQVIRLLQEDFAGKKIVLLAPVVRGRKGHYKELFEGARKKGFISARVDGEIVELRPGTSVDRYKSHSIEIVIDKLEVGRVDEKRLKASVATAMKHGKGVMMVKEHDGEETRYYSRHLMCPDTGLSYKDPAPHTFSFNSPHGACPKCKGLGHVHSMDVEKIIPDDSLSIHDGGILPLGKPKGTLIFHQIEALLKRHGANVKQPIRELPEEALTDILHGYPGQLRVENAGGAPSSSYLTAYEGIFKYIAAQEENGTSRRANEWAGQFISTRVCDRCHGQRLNREALHFFIDDKNISEIAHLELSDLHAWACGVEEKLEGEQRRIAGEILKEIRVRLKFMLDVGLEYLSLDRQAMTLSGGESQRIRLATQIGSRLVNVLYILDEPSIGLHQRDNHKLIRSLQELRDNGNSVIVVEHDKEMMEHADYIVDLGPLAGRKGGEIVARGTLEEIRRGDGLTARYLNGQRRIPVPSARREGHGKRISLRGCTGNNLQGVDVDFPLGTLIVVTGVSGSGKSSLVSGTLHPLLSNHFYRSVEPPLPYRSVEGIEEIDKVVIVDQGPIGKSPRSNPVTYTGLFTEIRKIFERLPEAQVRGYTAGRFSFNVSGGRCETCKGAGVRTIEMNFLPDIHVPCETCGGKRYNKETLEVRYRGKSIGDVLNMTINVAVEFFENLPPLQARLKVLQEVGLGYLHLGQPCTTLSGGESQRIKLAAELSKKETGRTLYILDEPTTGLHFEDVNVLLGVLQKLVDKGNTVIVIEHNLDVIKVADHVIDMGPGGGKAGGRIVIAGTPEVVARDPVSATAPFIREELEMSHVK